MSVEERQIGASVQISDEHAAETAATHGAVMTPFAAKAVAILRIATGLIFLWAFLDKLLGLGYATPSTSAWINGGSPTKGFLSGVAVGPFEATFQSWAGDSWADWLFMLGLLGIGVALILGIGLRIAAAAAGLMMLLMWASEWPLDTTLSSGEPSRSTNPLIDYHIVYALSAIVAALTYAGNTWGLGRAWARLVKGNRWLL